MLELDIQIACSDPNLPTTEQLQLWCTHACHDLPTAELTLRVVDESESRELNQTWRQRDYATNVLSFPAEIPDGLLDIPLLGDIVVCAPVVAQEALAQGKKPEAHWAHMIIHGCLHLQGYDHIEDTEAKVMETRERVLLAELGYPDPYFIEPEL